METNNKENWEELFDKGFKWEECGFEHHALFRVIDPENPENLRTLATPEYVKAFIKVALSSSKAKWKEELVGKIEEIKPSYITGDCTKEGVKQKNIYRQALQDCIEIIKEL